MLLFSVRYFLSAKLLTRFIGFENSFGTFKLKLFLVSTTSLREILIVHCGFFMFVEYPVPQGVWFYDFGCGTKTEYP